MEKIVHANEAGSTVLKLYKIDIKPKTVARDKGDYIIKGSVHQEDMVFVNIMHPA